LPAGFLAGAGFLATGFLAGVAFLAAGFLAGAGFLAAGLGLDGASLAGATAHGSDDERAELGPSIVEVLLVVFGLVADHNHTALVIELALEHGAQPRLLRVRQRHAAIDVEEQRDKRLCSSSLEKLEVASGKGDVALDDQRSAHGGDHTRAARNGE
jgi:hypothetical protein